MVFPRIPVIIGIWAVWSFSVLGLAAAVADRPAATTGGWGAELASIAPPLARWDSGWYYGIAAGGYRYDKTTLQNNVAFYPLYPLLMRWLHQAAHIPLFTAGTLLSLASLLAALLFIGDLADDRAGPDSGVSTVCALLLFPSAFFLLAIYTESLFLLTTAVAFWAARRKLWLLAGVAGALACTTRINGILIVVPLAWFAWEDAGRRLREIRWRPLAALLFVFAGAAAFPFFLWRRFGDPLLYIHSHGPNLGWPQSPGPIWKLIFSTLRDAPEHARLLLGGRHLGYWLDAAAAIFFVTLTILLFRSGLVAEALYCGSTLLLLFSTGSLVSFYRYALALFPCFYLVARLRHVKVAALGYAFAGGSTGMVLLTRFVRWMFAE